MQHNQPITEESEDLNLALTTVAQQTSALAATEPAVDNILAGLNELWQNGADQDQLDLIQTNAATLLDTAQDLNKSFHAALVLAQQFKSQRDAHLKVHEDLIDAMRTLDFNNEDVEAVFAAGRSEVEGDLDELQTAIRRMDISVPEIDDLVDQVREEAMVDADEYFADTMWESVHDEIFQATPLEYDEASSLIDILVNSNYLPMDHYLWDDLREWIESAEEAHKEGL